jgi:hypothetical protein
MPSYSEKSFEISMMPYYSSPYGDSPADKGLGQEKWRVSKKPFLCPQKELPHPMAKILHQSFSVPVTCQREF